MNVLQTAIKERYEGVQSFLQEGCLFLSLCSIAEEVNGTNVDVLHMVRVAKQHGWIDKANNLTVAGQCGLLEALTGKQWTRTVRDVAGDVKDNEYTVQKWVRGNYTHFKRRYVDTLVNSQTVAKGKMESVYVYAWS